MLRNIKIWLKSDRLASVIMNPKDWNIVKDYDISQGYPYLWSTSYKPKTI